MGPAPFGVVTDVAGESSCDSLDDVGDTILDDPCDDTLKPASALVVCALFGARGGGTEGGGVGGGSLMVGKPVVLVCADRVPGGDELRAI
jgi:hypothetical protein